MFLFVAPSEDDTVLWEGGGVGDVCSGVIETEE